MKKEYSKIKLFERLYNFLQAAGEHATEYAEKPCDFSRQRSLSLVRIAVFLLHMAKRSLSIELEDFFDKLGEAGLCVTKSAFSQARYKLRSAFFEDWNAVLLEGFESNPAWRVKKWKGHRLFGVDGSTLYLVNNEEMRDCFGVQRNAHMEVPMARIMCAYDVLNDLNYYASVESIHKDELGAALNWVEKLPADAIGIHDRGHTSFALMWMYRFQKRHFLMRCKLTFNSVVQEFVKSGCKSAKVKIKATKSAIERLGSLGIEIPPDAFIRVRLVSITLPGGEPEVLVTSLGRKHFSRKRLYRLYFKRWGVETFFDRLKNKLQVESFCGHLPKAVYQEFHAMIFLANLQACLVRMCKKDIQEIALFRAYDYQVNRNITLGILRLHLVAFFLLGNWRQLITLLMKKFIRYLEPVRPDRSFPRMVKSRRTKGKFQTLSNYRRAA